jgi:hypothetical protein
VLLFADRFPAASTAYTENVCVRSGASDGRVKVVCGGLTRQQLEPFCCTQYPNFPELSDDAFHASEMLVGVLAVIRMLVGVVTRQIGRSGDGVLSRR